MTSIFTTVAVTSLVVLALFVAYLGRQSNSWGNPTRGGRKRKVSRVAAGLTLAITATLIMVIPAQAYPVDWVDGTAAVVIKQAERVMEKQSSSEEPEEPSAITIEGETSVSGQEEGAAGVFLELTPEEQEILQRMLSTSWANGGFMPRCGGVLPKHRPTLFG